MISNNKDVKEVLEQLESRVNELEIRNKIEDAGDSNTKERKDFFKQMFFQLIPWILITGGILFETGSKLYNMPSPEQNVVQEKVSPVPTS